MAKTNVILETGSASGQKSQVGEIRFQSLPDLNPGLSNPIDPIPDDFSAPASPLPFQFEWTCAPDESSTRLDELAARIGGDIASGKSSGRDETYDWRIG